MSIRHYYADTAGSAPALPTLHTALDADVCVVGGGFAGLNTALGLAERGHRDVVLLEAEQPAFGASGRNGGFVFGGFSRGEAALLRDLGRERARALYAGTVEAVELIRRRIAQYGIACDDTQAGILWANWFDDRDLLRQRQALLADVFAQDWHWVERDELRQQILTPRYHDALFEPRAFHFHPLKYAHGLVQAASRQGVSLFGDSPAVSLQRREGGWRVTTLSGRVDAREDGGKIGPAEGVGDEHRHCPADQFHRRDQRPDAGGQELVVPAERVQCIAEHRGGEPAPDGVERGCIIHGRLCLPGSRCILRRGTYQLILQVAGMSRNRQSAER